MSIALAVKKDNMIAIAADTQTNFGSISVSTDNLRANKIMKVGDSFLAFTGWSLYENILFDFINEKNPPSLKNEKEIYSFYLKFWKILHEKYAFVNDQCDDDDSPFGDIDASFLIVNKNGIYHVASNMSVSKFEKYFAIGSGCDFALGAMYAIYDTNADALTVAEKSVAAAIAFSRSCGGAIDSNKIMI